MNRFLLTVVLLFGSALWGETVPLYFELYPQSMGSVTVGATSASGYVDVCQFPGSSCSPSYSLSVGISGGTMESWTTYDDLRPTVHQIVNFGTGGGVSIYHNHTLFLSGYVLSAEATSTTTPYSGWEWYERSLSGEFVASVLNPDYWGDTNPAAVGGSFRVTSYFPHSPYAIGGGYLKVNPVATPEPCSLTLLFMGAGAVGACWRKRASLGLI